MHSDGTTRCGCCSCQKYKEDTSKVINGQIIISEIKCVCGHTHINHVFNTKD